MIKLTINNIEEDVIDNWDELTTGQYIQLLELHSDKNKDLIPEEFLVKFISILTSKDESYINNLYEEEILGLVSVIENFKLDNFKSKDNKRIIMNDKLYSYVIPSQLTLGEKISIKLLEKDSKSEYEQWLNILSILVRPAVEKENEFGEVELILDKFNGDIEILKRRKNLLKSIPGVNAMHIIQAFTIGRE